MATDFTIGILPIFIVRHLQMNLRSKCAVVGILAMAAVFVFSAFILRLINLRTVPAPLPLFDSLTFKITAMSKISFASHASLIRSFPILMRS